MIKQILEIGKQTVTNETLAINGIEIFGTKYEVKIKTLMRTQSKQRKYRLIMKIYKSTN